MKHNCELINTSSAEPSASHLLPLTASQSSSNLLINKFHICHRILFEFHLI